MKKVLAIALMLLIPCTAFAMETLTVDEMAEITGQSGVAIALDDVKVFFYTENEETWYQSAGNLTAASNDVYVWQGALGLIRSDFGQMLYLNAILGANTFSAAAGNFTSQGTATEPNMDRNYMLRWTAPVAGFNSNYMGLNEYYGFTFGNKSLASVDDAFDSRALTIRAVNRAEVFSLAAYYRLETLRNLSALVAPGYSAWNAAGGTTNEVSIAAVAIGLPTAEIHYKRGAGETLEVALSTAANPLTRNGFLPTDATNSDFWSYGVIYYGGWRDPAATNAQELQTRTILVLDGFLEITPMEAYMRPNVYSTP
jgi:hypothetical protein